MRLPVAAVAVAAAVAFAAPAPGRARARGAGDDRTVLRDDPYLPRAPKPTCRGRRAKRQAAARAQHGGADRGRGVLKQALEAGEITADERRE